MDWWQEPKAVKGNLGVRGFAGLLLTLVLAQASWAEEGQGNRQAAVAEEAEPAKQTTHKGVEHFTPEKREKPIPVSFSLSYVLVSDYILRGINFSEYGGLKLA